MATATMSRLASVATVQVVTRVAAHGAGWAAPALCTPALAVCALAYGAAACRPQHRPAAAPLLPFRAQAALPPGARLRPPTVLRPSTRTQPAARGTTAGVLALAVAVGAVAFGQFRARRWLAAARRKQPAGATCAARRASTGAQSATEGGSGAGNQICGALQRWGDRRGDICMTVTGGGRCGRHGGAPRTAVNGSGTGQLATPTCKQATQKMDKVGKAAEAPSTPSTTLRCA